MFGGSLTYGTTQGATNDTWELAAVDVPIGRFRPEFTIDVLNLMNLFDSYSALDNVIVALQPLVKNAFRMFGQVRRASALQMQAMQVLADIGLAGKEHVGTNDGALRGFTGGVLFGTFILAGDDPRLLQTFGQEVAPAVRELVAGGGGQRGAGGRRLGRARSARWSSPARWTSAGIWRRRPRCRRWTRRRSRSRTWRCSRSSWRSTTTTCKGCCLPPCIPRSRPRCTSSACVRRAGRWARTARTPRRRCTGARAGARATGTDRSSRDARRSRAPS